jgi:hypothetical protein
MIVFVVHDKSFLTLAQHGPRSAKAIAVAELK